MEDEQQSPNEAKPPRGRFTIVYLIHEDFRRDLARLSSALRATGVDQHRARQLRSHWAFVEDQSHHHHEVEDASLWPLVRPKLSGRDEDLDVAGATSRRRGAALLSRHRSNPERRGIRVLRKGDGQGDRDAWLGSLLPVDFRRCRSDRARGGAEHAATPRASPVPHHVGAALRAHGGDALELGRAGRRPDVVTPLTDFSRDHSQPHQKREYLATEAEAEGRFE